MSLHPKRRRLSAEADGEKPSIKRDVAVEEEQDSDSAAGSASSSNGDESPDTEDEIELQRHKKSKKTQKRKRRAASPSVFGATLQSLLSTSTPSSQPLSLKTSVAKKRADEKLEVKAKKLLDGEKKEKEEKNHITDVIGGWGGEGERALRKVAQRGVVKLFNAIQHTQLAAAAEQEEAKASRGSGKPTLPAPAIDPKKKKGNKSQSEQISQDAFLSMIKNGGLVSKA